MLKLITNSLEKIIGIVKSNWETIVLELLNETLPVYEPLSSHDIERRHSIGKSNKKTTHQVMDKFKSYKTKVRVYDARFDLTNINMTEDFTPSNRKIVDKLVQMKNKNDDGKLSAKAHESQAKVRVNFKDYHSCDCRGLHGRSECR